MEKTDGGCSADETCNSTDALPQLPGHTSFIVTNVLPDHGHRAAILAGWKHTASSCVLHLCCGRDPFIRRIISQRPRQSSLIGHPRQMSTGADVNVETSVSTADAELNMSLPEEMIIRRLMDT